VTAAPQVEPEPATPGRLSELHPRRFFLETWQRMDAEAAEQRAGRRRAGHGYDLRPIVALCAGAALLTLMEYFGTSRAFHDLVRSLTTEAAPGSVGWALLRGEWSALWGYTWWAAWRVGGYFVMPALLVKLSGHRLGDQGLRLRGLTEHIWIYALAYAVVLACVIAVSFTDEFSRYYPFYKHASRSWLDLLLWELLYAAQFFALEFFFRGWWLAQLKPAMGSHAIFAMVVPYCMIHFGKPWLEALAAIVAGIVLGTLAMKTRSIWNGFFIHVSVAVSMDVAALVQTRGLPTQLWPG
jgi:membrane protease YdiL (CAAX protease family)